MFLIAFNYIIKSNYAFFTVFFISVMLIIERDYINFVAIIYFINSHVIYRILQIFCLILYICFFLIILIINFLCHKISYTIINLILDINIIRQINNKVKYYLIGIIPFFMLEMSFISNFSGIHFFLLNLFSHILLIIFIFKIIYEMVYNIKILLKLFKLYIL